MSEENKDPTESKRLLLSAGDIQRLGKFPGEVRERVSRIVSDKNWRIVDAAKNNTASRKSAMLDKLTGLPNLRAYKNGGERIISLSRRNKRECVVLMIDLDNFKNVNDSHGHEAGDKVLKEIAGILQSIFRKSDLFARIGGDEFVAVLPEINIENAQVLAERIREVIEDRMKTYGVTSSIGIAGSNQVEYLGKITDADFLEKLKKLADIQLYLAKESGRNRVVSSRNGETQPSLNFSPDD